MNNKFDERAEKSFKEIFSADSIEFRNVPKQEPRGHGILQRSLENKTNTVPDLKKLYPLMSRPTGE